MTKQLIAQIYKICPSDELKTALMSHDYEEASMLIEDIIDMYNPFSPDQFAIFDSFYKVIDSKDIERIKNLLTYCNKLDILKKIDIVIDFHILLSERIETKDYTGLYFNALQTLNNYQEEVDDNKLGAFAKKLISLRKKKMLKVKHFETVFSMPVYFDNEDPRIAFVSSILVGLQLTDMEVAMAYDNDDAQGLIEKIQIIAYLRFMYRELNASNREYLLNAISQIDAIGLEKTKDDKKS